MSGMVRDEREEGPGQVGGVPHGSLGEGTDGTWARLGPRPPVALPAGCQPLTPSRHTLSSLSAMARQLGRGPAAALS